MGTTYNLVMRAIARNVFVAFWSRHPETKVALERYDLRDGSAIVKSGHAYYVRSADGGGAVIFAVVRPKPFEPVEPPDE